jgi:hypothetical protein
MPLIHSQRSRRAQASLVSTTGIDRLDASLFSFSGPASRAVE